MTDVYRSEILAVVMQQIVDEPVLPVLFLRTVCGLPNITLSQNLTNSCTSGYSSGHNVQISCGLRFDDFAVTTHH
jgi:hypothetical protein